MHTGNDEHYYPGDGYANTDMRTPRGILNYTLAGRPATAISWKLTGNLGTMFDSIHCIYKLTNEIGGETYADLVRGPLNEGVSSPHFSPGQIL